MTMHSTAHRPRLATQRGGFALGLIIGLLISLLLALGVAMYVTKVPVPFINKVPQRTPEQDAAEVERNKNWDPNSLLSGKNPARPISVASAASGVATGAVPGPVAMPSLTPPPARPAVAPSAARPLAEASAAGASDAFGYQVQAGAFARSEDAEQQRAKLAMMGLEAKLTEREQSGHTVYRVRIGPFDKKSDADAIKDKLAESGIESALVRVPR